MTSDPLRDQLVKLLDWGEAHITLDRALEGLPEVARGRVPQGSPHSIWQLVEHMRIAQHDLLDFCVNPSYREMTWPDEYWPRSPAPSKTAWEAALAAYRRDRSALEALARDPTIDLFGRIPHGSGQTYLRELLLVADHGAYHIGQIVLIRRLLGVWTD